MQRARRRTTALPPRCAQAPTHVRPTEAAGHERDARPSDASRQPHRAARWRAPATAEHALMWAQPGSVRACYVHGRVRARVEPGVTTGAREYTGSSSLTFRTARRPLVVPPHRARRTKNVAKCCALGSPSSWRRPFCFALAGHPRWRRRFRAPSSTRMSSRPS